MVSTLGSQSNLPGKKNTKQNQNAISMYIDILWIVLQVYLKRPDLSTAKYTNKLLQKGIIIITTKIVIILTAFNGFLYTFYFCSFSNWMESMHLYKFAFSHLARWGVKTAPSTLLFLYSPIFGHMPLFPPSIFSFPEYIDLLHIGPSSSLKSSLHWVLGLLLSLLYLSGVQASTLLFHLPFYVLFIA